MIENGTHPAQNMTKEVIDKRNRKSYATKLSLGIDPHLNLTKPGVFERSLSTRIKNNTVGFQVKDVHEKTVESRRSNYIKHLDEIFKNAESVKLDFVSKPINKQDIDKYFGIPGVWSKELEDGTVLDVSETKDIGKEMVFSIRAIELGNRNANLSDKEIDSIYGRKSGIYKKYKKISAHDNIIFKVIKSGVSSKTERLDIEIQYAYYNNAVFWNPSPGQMKLGVRDA